MENKDVLLEQQVLTAFSMSEEVAQTSEDIAKLKLNILKAMKDSNVNELTIPLDTAYSLKVKLSERTTRKLDKEELAEDLGVSASAINTKFLLKAIEDKRLSYERYLEYIFSEINEGVSIRRVKAEGGKKK